MIFHEATFDKFFVKPRARNNLMFGRVREFALRNITAKRLMLSVISSIFYNSSCITGMG